MKNSTESIIKNFDIEDPLEQHKLKEYLLLIEPVLPKLNNNIASVIIESDIDNSNAKNIFEALLSIICRTLTTNDLIDYYTKYLTNITIENDDNELINLLETVVDSLCDEARFRASKKNASKDDEKFYQLFNIYFKSFESLSKIFDGITNAMVSLLHVKRNNSNNKKYFIIKELVPILSLNTDELLKVYGKECNDIDLIYLIEIMKQDLNIFIAENTIRFKSFFTPNEYNYMCQMNRLDMQKYLAFEASKNNGLIEAKKLLKKIAENENLLNEINIFESKFVFDELTKQQAFERLKNEEVQSL